MKREGRQHGLVRCDEILPPPLNSKPTGKMIINRFDSPPTAGFHTKVSSKPTNHSKFTGKCGRPRCLGCHAHPVSKSRDKAKGTHKLRSCDVVNNHRLIAWRIIDKAVEGPHKFYTGVSASGLLSHLSESYRDDMDDGMDDRDDQDHDPELVGDERFSFEDGTALESATVEEMVGMGPSKIEIEDDDDNADDDMDFYAVEFVWDVMVDGEDWCLVGEM